LFLGHALRQATRLDVAHGKFGRDEAGGIKTLIADVVIAQSDGERIARGAVLFDARHFVCDVSADPVRKRWVFFSRAILRQRASPVSGPELA
jgi:hypothetical protein